MAARKYEHLPAPGRLKTWREEIAKITQQEAADLMSLDLASYNAFERGRQRPGVDYVVKMETVTGGYVKASHWAQDIDHEIKRARAS